jgi:hypothetical protein
MHKLTKTLMHFWFSILSIGAFGFGWAFLAHSDKPAPLTITQPQASNYSAPALQPIPSLDDYLQNNSLPAQVFQSPTNSFPRLRTRGS